MLAELIILVGAWGLQASTTEVHGEIGLEVMSVTPEKAPKGLTFRIRAKLSNRSQNLILVETTKKESTQPDLIQLEKREDKIRSWSLVWGYQDVPSQHALEIRPGENVEFEFVIPSVVGSRHGWVSIRGVHRVRLRWFPTRRDFELYGSLRKANSFWAISQPFNIRWPQDTVSRLRARPTQGQKD